MSSNLNANISNSYDYLLNPINKTIIIHFSTPSQDLVKMSYQPKPEQAYTTSGNPATLEPAEQRAASQGLNTSENTEVLGKRIPQEQASEDQAVPTSRGRGVTGAPPGEEAHGKTNEQVGRHNELDAEQMAAPGEGKVYQAVEGWSDEKGKPGASGSQPDLASDLDR